MTSTVTAIKENGTEITTSVVFPPELDPRFDFVKTEAQIAELHIKRLAIAEAILNGPGVNGVRGVRIVSTAGADLGFDPNVLTVGDLPERMTR
jgi:hypothetical protein